eukprot:6176714-Pleurochrysis_carterae.AAC.3
MDGNPAHDEQPIGQDTQNAHQQHVCPAAAANLQIRVRQTILVGGSQFRSIPQFTCLSLHFGYNGSPACHRAIQAPRARALPDASAMSNLEHLRMGARACFGVPSYPCALVCARVSMCAKRMSMH